MQRQAESLLSKSIVSLLQSNQRLFQGGIEQSLANTRTASSRPFVIKNLQLLASKPGNAKALVELQSIAKSFVPYSFTGMSFYDVRGREVVRAGHFSRQYDLLVPLKSSNRAFLLWEGQFILQASSDILDQQGRFIGMVKTEARLLTNTEAFDDIASIGETGEFAVCAPLADDEKNMDCFLNRISRKEFKRLARAVEGRSLPMNYALNGENGIMLAMDYRREQVVAAYTPVGAYGLGMVIKIDQAELFLPVTAQLKFIVPLLVVLVMVGMLLLNIMVRPLVRKLVDSERTTSQLHIELSQFKNTLDQTLDCVFMFHPDTLRFTYVNEGAKRQVGYSGDELMQMTPVDIKPGLTLEQFQQLLQPLIEGVQPALTFQSVHRHKDGHEIPVEIFLQLVRLEGHDPSFVAMVSDISERKAAHDQIEFLAYHDALTGLPNRLLAKDHLQQAILAAERSSTKVALLFIDLDNFKTINDSLGHVIGDGLLKGAAIRLRECLRDTDTLSRQGGDEFLIVLNDVRDTESITVVAEKILARLAEPFEIDHHELSISLSIGIAVYPNDGKDFDTLLKQSDTAMYQAKESGRNTYRFHIGQMNIDAIEHLRMRNGLRRALEHGEFVLHYQPQISLANGAVIGAEALIRWNHPELGMVPPGRFISIAEDSGLIVPMGDWVLGEACRQAVAWHKAGLPELLIAVNLSAVQFKRGDVEKAVTQALDESGLNPALLELELTESILIKDTEKVLATVRQLKSLGVKLSIDDFGTGYSSLSYLKRFNVDKLKIDQSFVRDMADDPNDAAIVSAIIQMAKSLNLTTIAEGVEDERQLALLRRLHCDEVQGYYFARPMPADEFLNFVAGKLQPAAK